MVVALHLTRMRVVVGLCEGGPAGSVRTVS
jgi:hypothetical protein